MLSPATWGKWYAEFFEPVRRFLRGHLKNASIVDDLAQETFLRLQRLGDEELIENPHAYLMTMARNVATEWSERIANRADRQVRIDQSFDPNEDGEKGSSFLDKLVYENFLVPDVLVERQDVQYAVRAALTQLTRRQRHLIRRHIYDEKTYGEIEAAAKRNGTQSIRSKRIILRELTRAFAKLREVLGDSETLKNIQNTWSEKSPNYKPPKKFIPRRKLWEQLGPFTREEAVAICTRLPVEEAAAHYKRSKKAFLARINEFGLNGYEMRRLYLGQLRVINGTSGEAERVKLTPEQWVEMRDKYEYLRPGQVAVALGVATATLSRWRRDAAKLGPAYDLPYEETSEHSSMPSARYKSSVVQRYMDQTEEVIDGKNITRRVRGEKNMTEKILLHLADGSWYRSQAIHEAVGGSKSEVYLILSKLETEGAVESRPDGIRNVKAFHLTGATTNGEIDKEKDQISEDCRAASPQDGD